MLYIISTMYHYLRRLFSKPQNLRQVHRTVSGLDSQHIASGNYLSKNFSKSDLKKHFREAAESLKLLNIYGPGSCNRISPHDPPPRSLFNVWNGGLWSTDLSKTPHPSYQKPSDPSVPVKENSPLPASQKNSSFPSREIISIKSNGLAVL